MSVSQKRNGFGERDLRKRMQRIVLVSMLSFLASATALAGDLPQSTGNVSIVVGLQRLAAVDAPTTPEEDLWLSHFVRQLEFMEEDALRGLSVSYSMVLKQDGLSDSAGESLRLGAIGAGASHVVIGGMTELAERYSFDVRVVSVMGGAALAHLVLESEGPEGPGAAIDRAAAAVREVLLQGSRGAAPSDTAEHRIPAEEPLIPVADETVKEADDTLAGVPTIPQVAEGASGARTEDDASGLVAAATTGGQSVSEIRVSGNRRIEADAVRAAVGTRVGRPLQRYRIGEDIRRVYELGFFRRVEVLATDAPDGVIITFLVEEYPVIREVAISGNDSLPNDDIRDQLTITVGSTIDYPLLLQNKQRIEDLYKASGFYQVEVDYTVENLREDAVSVNFEVLEGRKLRLVSVEFQGNNTMTAEELMAVVQTKPWGRLSFATRFWDHSGVYAEPIFFQDLDRVSRLYMDNGFIRVRVGEPEVDVLDDGIRVRVPISEGPQYNVGTVDVAGDETMDTDELIGLVTMKPGAVFSRSDLSADVETLRSHYADRGFFSARVRPITQVDQDTLEVNSAFEVEKGELYFVDRIEVKGNARTRDQVVRRELGLAEGELYSARALERSRARVRRLGFFEEVNLETQEMEGTQRLRVDVDVVERPTGSFSFGAGVGSVDGFVATASVRQDNLFGKGYGVQVSADLGSTNQRASVRFVDPYFMGTPAGFSAALNFTDLEFVDFDQTILGFELATSYPLDEGETRGTAAYSLSSREISSQNAIQASSLLQRAEFQGKTNTSMFSLSFRQDTRDDIRFPRKGKILGGALELAGLGGLNKFIRIEGRGTWFIPFKKYTGFESTFVVNSRAGWAIPLNQIGDFDLPGCTGGACAGLIGTSGQAAALTNIDTDLKLPLSERYFLGGLGSFQVRGFKQRSLGPRRGILNQLGDGTGGLFFFSSGRSGLSSDGFACVAGPGQCNDLTDKDIDDFENLDLADVIGGNKMFLLNLELQVPISEQLGLTGLVFLDMGNSFAENESINPANLRYGTGGGIHWFSPFGPILLVLGLPLDPLEDEDASVFEFSLGGGGY